MKINQKKPRRGEDAALRPKLSYGGSICGVNGRSSRSFDFYESLGSFLYSGPLQYLVQYMGSLVLKGSTVRALARSCLDDVDGSVWIDGQLQ